jgi:hypothetical protein
MSAAKASVSDFLTGMCNPGGITTALCITTAVRLLRLACYSGTSHCNQ